MKTKMKKKTIKIISALLVISIIAPSVLFSMPKQIQAQGIATMEQGPLSYLRTILIGTSTTANVTNTAVTVKNVAKEILRQILMTITRRLLQQMTKSTVNWINSGFHGSPLFLENPESFFKDIAKYEIRTMVDMFGYDSNRYPFGKDFALNIIGSYKTQLRDNAQYTLSKVMTDPESLYNYQNNFNVGGWNAFLINTQYPQNNYLGFQMLATEALARKVNGTTQNAAQKVQTTLQQGMGFLSPQTCADNGGSNEYNKVMANAFQRPSWNENNYIKTHPYNNPIVPGTPTYDYSAWKNYDKDWFAKKEAAKAEFVKNNTCKNLVATTPGSVVANQITTAMGSTFRQSELGAAMGNSISAVLDALLNKFIGSGLNALASTVNPKPAPDTWEYEGQTLGSPADGTNDAWDMGPDEPIILSDFRKKIEGKTIVTVTDSNGATTTTEEIGDTTKTGDTTRTYIRGDIKNTKAELQLIYNESSTNPGIIQLQSRLWLKSRELDMCQPGPDLGWKERMETEMNRNSLKLQGKTSDSDGNLAAEAQLTLKELKFAVNFLKDWINNKMMIALPHSVIYMDAVEEIETLSQQANELTDKRRIKNQALARLEVIKSGLDNITTELNALPVPLTQPEIGSAQEEIMVSLYKQYKATADAISNPTSIDNMFNELTVTYEKLVKLNKLVPQCMAERATAGWTGSVGANSVSNGDTEKNIYCDAPIKGGYNHESFDHKNDGNSGLFGAILGGSLAIMTGGMSAVPGAIIGQVATQRDNGAVTHKDIPYVNAKKVLKWRGKLGIFGYSASIQMSCNIIWKANILDYKGNLPGTPETANIVEPYVPNDTSDSSLGTCTITKNNTTTGETETIDSDSNMTLEDCYASNGTSWTPNTPLDTAAESSIISSPTSVKPPASPY